jgi:alpha-mannosidase
MANPKRTFVVISHTHWDREWYQPFEQFRVRLVRMMDSLIELLDRDPEFKHFAMDGQTVPLDDYLEIRPEKRETIERLVRDGRLLAGPNYMLPDEFLIGGEAWVRNLQFGIRSARKYGAVMNVGYSPDAFGHIAHLPAILRGFGLDAVAIWRGVSKEATRSEFRWAAPDGSEVLAVHFPYGYGYMSTLPEDESALGNSIANLRTLLEPLASTSRILVPNGTDHLPAHDGLSGVIRTANALLDGDRMEHGSYPQFVEAVRKELGDRYKQLPLIQGELRSSERSVILAGVLSTRMWLKQRYAYCEDLLARYAEPLSAWAHILRAGKSPERTASDRGLLREAWRSLLQNGPHDSVTGCSVDPVYDDVKLRFQHCEQLADAVATEAQREIARAAAKPGAETVMVYNSEHGPRTDVCDARIAVTPGKLPARLIDDAGNETALQVIERGGHSPLDRRERVTVAFVAPDVPGFGYKTFRVEHDAETPEAIPTARAIENEFFAVSAEADGTITVHDKRTGRTFAGLHKFVDSGDCGDEYTYCPPDRDVVVDAPTSVQANVIEDGPARHILQIEYTYALPRRLTTDRKGRSDETVVVDAVTRVRLYPGVARVDIETEVANRVQDHRLRVLFPTGTVAAESKSEQHFGVVSRAVGVPEFTRGCPETPVGTYPQKTFTDISDGENGLALAVCGLPEYEALVESDGTITLALTLLRCVSWLSRDDLKTRPGHAGPMMHTPGAQLTGVWSFEYSLIPHTGDWTNAYEEAHRFARPLRAVRVSGGDGSLPAEASLVTLERREMIVSSVKIAEDSDAVALRAYNIADEFVMALLRLNDGMGTPQYVDLNEENPATCVVQGGAVRLTLKPNEITTILFGGEDKQLPALESVDD